MPLRDLSEILREAREALEAKRSEALKRLESALDEIVKEAEEKFQAEAEKPRQVARALRWTAQS